MNKRTRLLCGAAACVIGLGAQSAMAQQAPVNAAAQTTPAQQTPSAAPAPANDSTVSEVVVTGIRASLESAQQLKRNSSQIVDSIVAQDIGKLPDVNTAEALQRVTGVQINRDLGEGSTVVVRGLSQVETLLNGHEVFTASGTRALNFEFIPSELLSAVDVYKSQSADLVEGGLGGTINVRTRRPFDFKGFTAAGSLTENWGSLADRNRPQVSALLSNRWSTGAGEIGALASISYQERNFREDYISAGAPLCYGPVVAGACSTVIGPNGFYNPQYYGTRRRLGLDGVLQWRPNPELEFYVEGAYTKFGTEDNILGSYPTPFPAGSLSNIVTYPGTNFVKSADVHNEPLRSFGVARDTTDENTQWSAGGTWRHEGFTVTADGSYESATSDLYYTELDLQTTVPTFSFDTSTSPPSQTATGVDLTNPANYNYQGLTYSVNNWVGHEGQVRLDGSYDFADGPLQRITIGGRWAQADDQLSPIRYSNQKLTASATQVPQLIETYPLNSVYTGAGVPEIGKRLLVNPSHLRGSLLNVFSAFGLPTTMPGYQPQGIFKINEKDLAAYIKGDFKFDLLLPIDGNVGVRVAKTSDDVTGTETINASTGTTYKPIAQSSSYTDVLPSANVRIHLTDDLLLRLAASKSVTRPEFSNLNPGLTLVPANLTGNQGNPDLQPFRAKNYDASLEWYFSRAGSLYGAYFHKDVQGFVFNKGVQQTVEGQLYTISQPVNSGSGKIDGFEVGYQQTYTFLPEPFDGLGVQANATFVDSSANALISTLQSPLPNLSKWSYNAIAFYEKGPLSARVAWNWRSRFITSISAASGVGVLPVYSAAFGQLDAAITYDVSRHVTLTLEGENLTKTQRQTYIGTPMSPIATYQDDLQVLGGVRFKW